MKLVKLVAISAVTISSIFIFSACSKPADSQKQQNVKTTSSSSAFALISGNCNAVGEFNIAEITKIPEVAKVINDRKDLPYVKEATKVGLDLNNIAIIDIGVVLPNKPITTADPSKESNGIVVIKTKNTIDISSFIKLEDKSKDTAFKEVSINGTKGYMFEDIDPATSQNEKLYVVQLNDKTIIMGTEKEVTNSIALSKGSGTSILNNKEIATLTNNFSMQNMFWLALVIPSGLYENASKNIPNINDGLLTADYSNNTLALNAVVDCKTKDDVQKITLPFQMISSFIIMSSNNLIKPENMTINTKDNQVSIHVSLSNEAIQTLIAEQMKAQQQGNQDDQSVQSDNTLSEEGVLPNDTSSEK